MMRTSVSSRSIPSAKPVVGRSGCRNWPYAHRQAPINLNGFGDPGSRRLPPSGVDIRLVAKRSKKLYNADWCSVKKSPRAY